MATTTETRPSGRRPIPPSTAQAHHFFGVDDVEIFYRVWRPEGPPHAVLVIAPGFNSHSGHYEWVGHQLANVGVAVYAIDHRGRGRSDGERFFVRDVHDYVQDLATLINIARARNPGLRVFLLGHSAGGVVASMYVLEHPNDIDGLICESAAFKLPVPGVAAAAIRAFARIAPHRHLIRLKNKYFSRDPAVVEAMDTDPLIASERQALATMAALVRADAQLTTDSMRITMPMLIVHGTADQLADPIGSERFFDKASSSDKTLKLYDGYFHDLLNDVGKELVLADIESWIHARTLS